MATVRLGRFEVEAGRLPPVCMACGAPAACRETKKFSWHPPWVVVFALVAWPVYLVLAVILTKRMTFSAPACERHKRYFFLRYTGLWLSLLLLLVVGCGGFYGFYVTREHRDSDLGFLYALAFLLVFLFWLIVAAVIGQRSIRPSEITDNSITLLNVSEPFAKAVQLGRMGPFDELPLDVLPADERGSSEQYYDPKGK